MTKLAFTSCMLVQRFDSQPVWQRIQAQDPDHLVLLGNAIHLDIDVAVRGMSAGEFAEHAHGLYRAQLAVPAFDALAARHRLLLLSGDLLRNDFASHGGAHGRPLHEATASGAAARDAAIFGAEVENFAVAEIDAAQVVLRFFDRDGETVPRRIDRERWAVTANA